MEHCHHRVETLLYLDFQTVENWLHGEHDADVCTSQVASHILEPTSRTLPKKAQTARVQAVDPPAYPQDLQGQTGYSLEKASSFSMLHNVQCIRLLCEMNLT